MNHEKKAKELIRYEHPGIKEIFTVWMCKTLQNWKGIFGSPENQLLWEVTYNGDKGEYYIDCYEKKYNLAIIPVHG